MKVGFFFNDPKPRSGGVFTYQQDIFHSFLRLAGESAHEFHVICEYDREEDFASLPGRPGNVHISPMAAPPPPPPPPPSRRQRLLRLRGHEPVLPPPPVPAAEKPSRVLAAKGIEFTWSIGHYEHNAFDVPYMITVFDLQHRLQPWFPEVSRDGLWQERENYFSRYVSRATYVITGTQEGRREIENCYNVPSGRIRVLPLPTPGFCLNPPAVDTAQRLRALGITGRFLFYPAQYWPHKNHANLLEALRLVNAQEAEPFQLALVGSDHGNLEYVRGLAQSLQVEQHVLFLGFVAQEDLVALYQGAFALVYTSLFGPDNLPPLEAFALGCPVIMSDYPGAREQLGQAPIYVQATKPGELADAIRHLAQNPQERPRMIAQGQERARSWTATDYVRDIFAILDEFASIRRCWK